MPDHLTDADHLAYITAGADPTALVEGGRPTPGQLLHRLLTMDVDRRLRQLASLLDAGERAYQCFAEDHVGRLAELERQVLIGWWLIAEARWVATREQPMIEQADAIARWTDDMASR